MKNPLTLKVESYIGSLFILVLAAALVVFFLSFTKEMEAELDILNSDIYTVRLISNYERNQIMKWVEENDIRVPQEELYLRYLLKEYPERPWL